MQFQLFDSVKTIEEITLCDGGTAPVGTYGAIVEVFKDGEAYMVELLGDWVKYDESGNFVTATPDEKESFVETIGVETVYPHQLQLVKPASETVSVKAHILSLLDNLPENYLIEVRDFADFLQNKEQRKKLKK